MTPSGRPLVKVCARGGGARASLAGRRTSGWIAGFLLVIVIAGCSTTKWVSVRSTPRNPLSDALGLVTRTGPKPTERTLQLLRRYDLEDDQGDKPALLAELTEINRREPNRENLYALAELAYVGAKRAEVAMQQDQALELYGSAVLFSYQYLFDENYPTASNEFDPQFRRACDLYNGALESTLRIAQAQGALRPGTTRTVQTANHACEIEIVLKSKGWHAEDFDRVEFVSDYEVHGLRNHYHNFGLGVPLIAVRKHHEDMDPREQFYPPDLSFAVTAFMRLETEAERQQHAAGDVIPASATDAAAPSRTGDLKTPGGGATLHAVLELRDPLEATHIDPAVGDAPLETDLSTPLAFFLSQPAFDDNRVSTYGLLHPEEADKLTGLYMLEPFDPEKIPVVMVHGLWSSPVTWMEMFNDLRSDPAIRNHYQFWFYLYPSGQPFWFSAARMREDLAHMRAALDPQRQAPALDQTVLVGHSMGGLVSKLQTVDSGNEFWRTLSDKPFSELQADPEIRDDLAEAFFFDPNPSIRCVITIGTPHRGSDFSNNLTKWLGRKLIDVPSKIMQGRSQLVTRNPDYFLPAAPLNITNAIDSLSPKSPILPVLLAAPTAKWVKYYNIVGQAPRDGFTSTAAMWLAGEGDGVVSLASAQLEGVAAQEVVPADHQMVHRHPQSILAVRKILRQHLVDLKTFPYGSGVEYAASEEPSTGKPAPQLPGPVATLPPDAATR
jgi:pimeloyl-ACP methyl ester carboxylesterase